MNRNVCILWVTQENKSILLRDREDSNPVRSIWFWKRLTVTCWRSTFPFCYFHADWTAVLADYCFDYRNCKEKICIYLIYQLRSILCIISDTNLFIQTICHFHHPKLIVYPLCSWLPSQREQLLPAESSFLAAHEAWDSSKSRKRRLQRRSAYKLCNIW